MALEDFNVQVGELVIVEGQVAMTSIIEPRPVNKNNSTMGYWLKLVNPHIVDASRGQNLATYIQQSRFNADAKGTVWLDVVSKTRQNGETSPILFIDKVTGTNVVPENNLASGQTVQVAFNSFMPKSQPRMGMGVEGVLLEDFAHIQYYEGGRNLRSIFNLTDVQPAAGNAFGQAPQQAPQTDGVFGQSAQPESPFGQAAQTGSPFGQNPQAGSPFGNASNIFGGQN